MRIGSFVIDRDPVYVGTRTLRVISAGLLLLGVVALGFAAVQLVRSFVVSPAPLKLPVALVEGASVEEAFEHRLQTAYAQTRVTANGDGMFLTTNDPTRTEMVLGAAGEVLLAVAIGTSALLLRPLLASIADGRPFAPGNARRLAHVALITTAAAVLVPLIPRVATMQVLDRLELVEEGSPFLFGMTFSLTPVILFPLVLLVLAEAFRQGEKLHRDVEGLV
ncbi:DUF2975 domain-containing protein [Kineosporia babensis]|uniref:DUF2975 domain-containing protein n=1 Tax=Kineosporia babensis TaxID=499548 RepID=A0A9X1SZS2_9ACTN|nr:DUF2975 domain-containing protein [Kineosporia babensis]MCD5312193.1 DUF2975 domain-containing protein [Kineosporia babensis]